MIRGKFDDGWDQAREEIFARQKMGCPNGIYIARIPPRMQNIGLWYRSDAQARCARITMAMEQLISF